MAGHTAGGMYRELALDKKQSKQILADLCY